MQVLELKKGGSYCEPNYVFEQNGLGLWCTVHESTNKPLIAV